MTLPFNVPLTTNIPSMKENWIDLKISVVNLSPRSTFCRKKGQGVRDEALKIAEDWPGVCPRLS